MFVDLSTLLAEKKRMKKINMQSMIDNLPSIICDAFETNKHYIPKFLNKMGINALLYELGYELEC